MVCCLPLRFFPAESQKNMFIIYITYIIISYSGWHKGGNIAVEAFCQYCPQCFMDQQTEDSSKPFVASTTQILHPQHMLHGQANKETFEKHSKSVFFSASLEFEVSVFQCFAFLFASLSSIS